MQYAVNKVLTAMMREMLEATKCVTNHTILSAITTKPKLLQRIHRECGINPELYENIDLYCLIIMNGQRSTYKKTL